MYFIFSIQKTTFKRSFNLRVCVSLGRQCNCLRGSPLCFYKHNTPSLCKCLMMSRKKSKWIATGTNTSVDNCHRPFFPCARIAVTLHDAGQDLRVCSWSIFLIYFVARINKKVFNDTCSCTYATYMRCNAGSKGLLHHLTCNILSIALHKHTHKPPHTVKQLTAASPTITHA